MCNDCMHREVCQYTEQYKKTQEAINNVLIGTGDRGGIHLRDIKWIDTKLTCKNYMAPVTYRTTLTNPCYSDSIATAPVVGSPTITY